MQQVKFLLNDEWVALDNIDPKTSVLDFLRLERRLIGTKEGCASGDCGACTVVLAEGQGESLNYQAVNACITPVATLHAKQLITVEHLKRGHQLHKVQQAMVDFHGSQCGFCTPGFIMSMFAYDKNYVSKDSVESRHDIMEALGGNLCRCTGYRPIIDATSSLQATPSEDQFSQNQATTLAKLSALSTDDVGLEFDDHGHLRKYFAPSTLDSLADILKQYPSARLLAGGTDLCLEFTQSLKDVDVLVYLGRVAELITIAETQSSIELGAAVSYSRATEILLAHYPSLQELLDRLGSRQVRNQGTIGGNVANASPIGDMPPVLIALGAELVLRKQKQTRRIAVEDYFISYKLTSLQKGEIIESISIPKPDPESLLRAYKISKRMEDDISASCVAIQIKLDAGVVAQARIAFGGMAEIPKRAKHVEAALVGQAWTLDTINAAQTALEKDYSPISDFRASADYRLQVSKNLLQRFYLEFSSQQNQSLSAAQLRVTHYA
ncbi:MAG: xanthine dehydrogenase small subunit [Arenicella sp.]